MYVCMYVHIYIYIYMCVHTSALISIGKIHENTNNYNSYCLLQLNKLVGSEKLVRSCFTMFKLIHFMFGHL